MDLSSGWNSVAQSPARSTNSAVCPYTGLALCPVSALGGAGKLLPLSLLGQENICRIHSMMK